MSVDAAPAVHPVPLDVPAFVPGSGDRRRHPAPAHLRFFHGPMDCGKSTLALQVDHNQSHQGRHGLLLTQGDRSAAPQISSRVGLCRAAWRSRATSTCGCSCATAGPPGSASTS